MIYSFGLYAFDIYGIADILTDYLACRSSVAMHQQIAYYRQGQQGQSQTYMDGPGCLLQSLHAYAYFDTAGALPTKLYLADLVGTLMQILFCIHAKAQLDSLKPNPD